MTTLRSFYPKDFFMGDILTTLRYCDNVLNTNWINAVRFDFYVDSEGLFLNHLYEDKAFVDFVTAVAQHLRSAKKLQLATIQEIILLKLGYHKEQIEKERKKAGCFIL